MLGRQKKAAIRREEAAHKRRSVLRLPSRSVLVEISSTRPHLVTNDSNNSPIFLVLQGIGEYDYIHRSKAVTIPIFHVDAFAEKPFEGNPAAVCLLREERPDSWMQSVAAEVNLSTTAFVR